MQYFVDDLHHCWELGWIQTVICFFGNDKVAGNIMLKQFPVSEDLHSYVSLYSQSF